MDQIETENILEIIGCYFVNRYWNTFYDLAVDATREHKYPNMQVAYSAIMEFYTRAFCQQESTDEKINRNYQRVITDLHGEYRTQTQDLVVFAGFMDKLYALVLPSGYSRHLSRAKKEKVFRQIITKSIARYTAHVQEKIRDVLETDHRGSEAVMLAHKETLVAIIQQECGEYRALLIAQDNGIDIRREEVPHIPKTICDKLQSKIKELIEAKAELVAEHAKYVELVARLKQIIITQEAELKVLRRQPAVTQPWRRQTKPAEIPTKMPAITENPAVEESPVQETISDDDY